jgi:hypothetical protein
MKPEQRCELCDLPTGRTTEDELTLRTESGGFIAVCEDCHDEGEFDEDADW